jgi:hypothetical protein
MAEGEDAIGYRKPPRATRFRTGVSGNPQGRPKGSCNVANVLAKMLSEKVVVNEKGRRKVMSKLERAISRLVDLANSGNLGALRQLLALATSNEDRPTDAPEKQLSEPDRKVLQSVLKRIESCSGGSPDGNES